MTYPVSLASRELAPGLHECAPRTLDGLRRLALIAVQINHPDLMDYLDGLELLAISRLGIQPELPNPQPDRIEAVGISHERGGPFVHWLAVYGARCSACEGDGQLVTWGANGRRYRFECPECDGVGDTTDREDRFLTDIDGNLLPEALAV